MSRALDFPGPAGRLEGLLDGPEARQGPGAVLAHPHPLRGGTLHNTVVYRTAKALAAAGIETLRFNFRGVGRSEGTHDEGGGETLDYRAALDALAACGRGPLLAAGYSFGAVQALRASAEDPRVKAVCAIGFPLTIDPGDVLRAAPKPTLVVQGDQDPLGSLLELTHILARSPNVSLTVVRGAGHFFEGKADEVAAAVVAFAIRHLVNVS